MRTKLFRVTALLLSIILLISSAQIAVFAKQADTKTPQIDENGKYYFSYEAGGTYVMNMLDELLSSVNNGMDMYIDAKVTNYTLTLQSYDKALGSIYEMWDSTLISIAVGSGIGGDLSDLNVDCLESYTKRSDANFYDVNCIYNLVHFLYDNEDVLHDILTGDFSWGLIDDVVDLPEVITDTDGYLANTLYTLFEGLTGKEEGTSDTDTTYNADGTDVDTSINDLLIWFLNDKLGELLSFEGGLGVTSDEVNVTSSSLYDVVGTIIQSALDNLVVPLLKDVLMNAFGIETSEAYPNGTADQMNNSTMTMVLGIVEDLLSESETKPDYSNCQYPGEKIETLLKWFFLEGGMQQYIVIDDSGISIQDGLIDLLNSICRLAVPLLYSMGMDYLPKDYLYTSDELAIEEGEEGYIPNSAVYAQLINIALSSLVQGYYCNPEASSIGEVGAYCLASLCARITPEINYIDQLDANYVDDIFTDYEGNTVTALPFYETWTINGQYNNNGTWIEKTSTYVVPAAAIDMGITVGVYFLDGLITADFSQVPATGTNIKVRFEKFVKVLVDWAVNKYLPLFKTTYSLSTKYPSYSDVWKEVDEILFGLIPTSWLPDSITDHTPTTDSSNTYMTSGNGGATTFVIQDTADLLGGWLIGSVQDLDIQELISIFQRNTSSNAEFNQPILTVLIRIIDRVFYILLGKYTILPSNQGSRDAYTTNTTITSLNNTLSTGLLYAENLGNLAKYLIHALGSGTSTFNINTKTVPILQTVLPLIMSLSYIKPYRSTILSNGEIRVDELQELINLINDQGSKTIPYTVADVNETTTGTYYILNDDDTITQIVLDTTNYDSTETYYEISYTYASDVDKYTYSETYNNGDGVYIANETYTTITLDGTNYVSNQYYYSTDYTVATVDETTNGTYYTSQNETSQVTLPDNYVEGTTYYTHPEVVLGASSTGTYYIKNITYTPITLTGTSGTNFNANKHYYKKVFTNITYNYLNAYSYTSDPTKGRIAMGIYSAGSDGVGVYSSSISGQNFCVFREQEDFPDALYAYNNFDDFIDDAESFIAKYKAFLETMKEDADTWKEFFANQTADTADDNVPSTNYPFYTALGDYGRRVTDQGLTSAQFNNLQAIQDFIALYGESSFITSSTTNNVISSGHNAITPLSTLPSSRNAGTTDTDKTIYTQWNNYVKDVVEYSNNLNNYYDGINYYLQTAESSRQPYTDTKTDALEWAIYSLTTEAYNNGQNRVFNEETQQYEPIYTESSYNAFKTAYDAALSVLDQVNVNQSNVKTTQSMVTAARSGLIKAFYNLTKAGELADKTQLYKAIVEARLTLSQEDLNTTFTAESIQTLQTVLSKAVTLFEEVTEIDEQSTVDNLAARLNGAISGLVYLEAPGITTDENSNVKIDNTFADSGIQKGFIYGLNIGTGLTKDTDIFTIKGISANNVNLVENSYGKGTGASLVGKNGSDTKFEYYAVIYGDINGDARIDGTDKNYVQAYSIEAANTNLLSIDKNSGAALMAADVDGDGEITSTDAVYIGKVAAYEAEIDQNYNNTGNRVILL